MLLSNAPTSEALSPKTVLTENICRCVPQIIEYHTAIMPFLTTSKITFSCLASAAPQADSWRFGHVVPDDVVIADIAGQGIDIFLHVPESAHKNGILKTFTHRSIPVQPCTLLKQTKSKTLKSSNLTPSFTGLRYLSPRYSVCAEEWDCKNRHSLTHSFRLNHAHS